MSYARELRLMLDEEAPGYEIEITGNNHLKILLPNGAQVHASGTPGDSRRSLLNTRSDVRRGMRQPARVAR